MISYLNLIYSAVNIPSLGHPLPKLSRCTPYTSRVAADISVIVLIVICAASAGFCAVLVLRLWRA
jgi:hypothetical protein